MAEYAHREVLDKHMAADYLGLSVRTIERRAMEGIIGRRLGKKWRFTMSELRDYAHGRLTIETANQGAKHEQVEAGDAGEGQNGTRAGMEA